MINVVNSIFNDFNISFNNSFFNGSFNNNNLDNNVNNVNIANYINNINNINNINDAIIINNVNNANNINNNVNDANNINNNVNNNANNVNNINNVNNVNNANIGANNENNIGNENEQLFLKKKGQYIRDLNEFQFKHLSKYSAVNEDSCAICILKFKGFDIIKELSCNHIFHKNCIFKWLKKSNLCPLCKHDFTDEVNNVNIIPEDDDE